MTLSAVNIAAQLTVMCLVSSAVQCNHMTVQCSVVQLR